MQIHRSGHNIQYEEAQEKYLGFQMSPALSSHLSTASRTICYSLFLSYIYRNLQWVKTINLANAPYLILAIRHQNQCRCYLHKQTQLSEKDCSQPLSVVSLQGNLGNLKIAPRLPVLL